MDLINPKTILIVQIGKIGDMILTTPLFSELKRLFPNANLKVLASEINKDIPLNHSSVNEVIIYKKNLLKNLLLLHSSIFKCGLWIDTKDNYSKTSEILIKVFRPEFSMGFNFAQKVFDISLGKYQAGNHAVDINLSPVNYFENSVKVRDLKPSFNIPEKIKKKIDDIISLREIKAGELNIVMNISAGSPNRYIEKNKWLNVIKNINLNYLSSFTLTGLERDRQTIEYLLKNSNSRYIKTENILETSEVIRRSDIVISPDTSVVHICSVFNKPVVALYPDVKWNLEKFYPLTGQSEVLISKSENSITHISAEEIVKSFKKLLENI